MHKAEQGRNEKGNGGWDKMTGIRITWGTREGEKGEKFASLIYSNLLEGILEISKYRLLDGQRCAKQDSTILAFV